MRVFSLLLISLIFLTDLKAEKVHSNEVPSKKLSEILKKRVPSFKANASLHVVLESLKECSLTKDPNSRGFNIILIFNSLGKPPTKTIKNNQVDDPFAESPAADPFGGAPAEEISLPEDDFDIGEKYNFDLENLSFGEIIRYITEAGDLQYRIDENSVVIGAKGVQLKEDPKWTNALLKNKIDGIQKEIDALQYQKKVLEDLQKGVKTEKPKEKAIDKLLDLVIPKIRFENRSMDFAVFWLKRKTRELADDGNGINIIVKLDKPVPKINIDVDNLPVKDLIKYIAEQTRLEYKVSENAVLFTHPKKPKLIKKSYRPNAGLIKLVGEGGNVIETLQKMGISFPAGSQIYYHKKELKVTISNTEENHNKLEALMKVLEKNTSE